MPPRLRLLPHAPEELTGGRLCRLGEGVGKVVYASEHWVVTRERSASDILALVVIWRMLRRFARILPAHLGETLLQRPSKWIRLVRVGLRPLVLIIPRSLWLMTHVGQMWKVYRSRDTQGKSLADAYLAGTSLVPERVSFPPVRVRVGGWPGWLTVSEASERVEETLYQRLQRLSDASDFKGLEHWLDRFLELRQAGWKKGVFSTDAHLKNYGVTGDRVVLIDSGGLTDSWHEIEPRLASQDDQAEPHLQLGLGEILRDRPDIAQRFNARWREIVSRSGVLRQWPGG